MNLAKLMLHLNMRLVKLNLQYCTQTFKMLPESFWCINSLLQTNLNHSALGCRFMKITRTIAALPQISLSGLMNRIIGFEPIELNLKTSTTVLYL